jgi:4-hydroxy-2-oxoheptanedioate aldolase
MKINTAKQKMLRGEPAFGYSAKLGSPVAAEFMSRCGADFVMLDGQHGSWGPDSLIQGLTAICTGPATPLARVVYNFFPLMGQLLDAGALGIVVPMVDTAEEARAVAAACRYPPVGERSFGWGRALTYGDDYTDWVNDQLFVAVQIESVQAVENAEAIMAVPGIDGCMIGPADLACSMGFHPREAPKREEHNRMLERVVQACRSTGKIPGIDIGMPDTIAKRVEQGFLFIPMGSDVRFLNASAAAGIKLAQEAAAKLKVER